MSMTHENIISKTKRMLGDNYRGDTEVTPTYSDTIALENYLNSYLVLSNSSDVFTDSDLTTITSKINNYSWYVANRGYLVNSDTQESVSALVIYGSEEGTTPPDVLNLNVSITDSYYAPINRTDTTGAINTSTNHVYVTFTYNDETIEYEIDTDGTPTSFTVPITTTNSDGEEIEEEITFNYYSGRLYPEDAVTVNSSITYPIYLFSNLEYYYITDDESINITGAHNTTQTEQNNLEILQDVCEMVETEAAQWTNRDVNEKMLNECWPVIVKCACMAYLNRGAEGMSSQTELGQQNNYQDWTKVLHEQIMNRRYVI